jgi:hypothetical protein
LFQGTRMKCSAIMVTGAVAFLLTCTHCINKPVNVRHTTGKGVTVAGFCLSENAVEGWIPWEHPCKQYGCRELFDGGEASMGSMDGGAGFYQERGLASYIYQEVTRNTQSARMHVMDMGTTENALRIYSYRKNEIDSPVQVHGYEAFLENYGSACILYACFDRFYLEMTMQGMESNELSSAAAQHLLSFYTSRFNH